MAETLVKRQIESARFLAAPVDGVDGTVEGTVTPGNQEPAQSARLLGPVPDSSLWVTAR